MPTSYTKKSTNQTILATGFASTFRAPGRAGTAQPIFTLSNATDSTILVAVARINVQLDATAVLTAVQPQVKLFRCATSAISQGTAVVAGEAEAADAASNKVIATGDASADGTSSASALTVSAVGTLLWQGYAMRLHTLVGFIPGREVELIPPEAGPIILAAGEALCVRVDAAVGTSNPVTNHWLVNALWHELGR